MDVARRLKQHNTGRGAKFTKGKGPWELLYTETIGESYSDALKRERKVKSYPKRRKLALCGVL